MRTFMWGVLAMASLVSALFFLRFWRESRERLETSLRTVRSEIAGARRTVRKLRMASRSGLVPRAAERVRRAPRKRPPSRPRRVTSRGSPSADPHLPKDLDAIPTAAFRAVERCWLSVFRERHGGLLWSYDVEHDTT